MPGFRCRNRCRKVHGNAPENTRFLAIGARKTIKMRSQNRDAAVSFLLLPRSPRVSPRCQSNPQACQNGDTRPPKSQFGELKLTTFFCFGHKCLENKHPEASEPAHISAVKFSATKTRQTQNNNATSHQTVHSAQLSRTVAILVARQQPMPNKCHEN